MKEKKLDSFHFYKVDETHFRVMHKSGMVEILEVQSTQSAVALPVEIYSPAGHKITLSYKTFNGAHILDCVKDDSGQTLLKLNRDSASVEILMQPSGGSGGGPLARFVMTLESSTKYVTKITLPTDDQASWRFKYRMNGDQLYMSGVETPSGGREEMFYDDYGHEFPSGSNREPIPRVTRHLSYPGFGQPAIDVRYTYKSERPGQSEKNFLGRGLSIEWNDDGLDNLFRAVVDYEYVCVESLWVPDEPTEAIPEPEPKRVRSIERTFNQFHLLTSEVTTQNNHIETVETDYCITPGVLYEHQPSNCQMPKLVKTTWSFNNKHRSETVSNTYDNFGNLLTRTQPNGIVEINTWFSAAGGDGCPPDREGFVRQLKDKTITPAYSPNGSAPTLRTRYRYTDLPPVAGSSLHNWLPLESQTLVEVVGSEEKELERTVFAYVNNPKNAFLHGRVTRQTTTLSNKSTFVDYDYQKIISQQLGVPVQQTTETVSTDFDTTSRAILRQHSLMTSKVLLSSSDGVEVLSEYDNLGRLTREIVAKGTEYEATRQYAYILSARIGLQAEHISIDAKKVKTRSLLDGLGRLIYQERDHVDENAAPLYRRTLTSTYDAWGNQVEQTVFDWMDGKYLALKSHFYYDDWAQLSRTVSTDGVEVHQIIDPIGTDESLGPIHRSWTQSAGPTPAITGLNETWMNLFGKPKVAT